MSAFHGELSIDVDKIIQSMMSYDKQRNIQISITILRNYTLKFEIWFFALHELNLDSVTRRVGVAVDSGHKHDDVIEWNTFRVAGSLWGEFTGDRWIPLTEASDAELWCFLWSAIEQTIE